MVMTVTQTPDRTQARPVRARLAAVEERRTAGLVNIAGQLEEAFQRGYAECARRHGIPQAASRPRHLSAIPGGGAS
jgi:hypothetical protein